MLWGEPRVIVAHAAGAAIAFTLSFATFDLLAQVYIFLYAAVVLFRLSAFVGVPRRSSRQFDDGVSCSPFSSHDFASHLSSLERSTEDQISLVAPTAHGDHCRCSCLECGPGSDHVWRKLTSRCTAVSHHYAAEYMET